MPPETADAHEEELTKSSEMQSVDIGFWAFYAGDHGHLDSALAGARPRAGYHKTIDALLRNLLLPLGRDSRRFDFRTLGNLLGTLTPRAVTREEREVFGLVAARQPRERDARAAWENFRSVVEQTARPP